MTPRRIAYILAWTLGVMAVAALTFKAVEVGRAITRLTESDFCIYWYVRRVPPSIPWCAGVFGFVLGALGVLPGTRS